MSDISGLSSRTPLAFFDPDSSSWKTSRPTFLSDSMSSSLTLPASGMTLGGVLYALPMSGPATDEPGSSSLPTPTAGDAKSTRNATAEEGWERGKAHSGTTLTDAVALLPTPVAHDDGKSPEAHMAMKGRMPGGARDQITSLSVMARQAGKTGKWDSALLPTPNAWDGDRGPDYAKAGRENSGGDDLVTTMARMLPTPTSRDHKGRNQRDDETCLPGAVGNLLPTPSAADGLGGHERRGGARTDELLLAGLVKQVSTGEPTDPPSSDTPAPSVEQLRIL